MNRFTPLFLLLLSIGCVTDNNQNSKTNEIAMNNTPVVMVENNTTKEPYDIKFQIETTENNEYYLTVTMELHNGSHFISPHAKRDFTGKFNISMEDNDKVILDPDILETPRSVEEHDPHPFVNGVVNWVRVSTIYKQKINIKSLEDFDAIGEVVFTIEPRCTLEQVRFIFKYRSGKIRVEKLMC